MKSLSFSADVDRGRVLPSDELDELEPQQEIDGMAKG
jgi:hypothetical protein